MNALEVSGAWLCIPFERMEPPQHYHVDRETVELVVELIRTRNVNKA